MGAEIQRASDADRERYAAHLSTLFADGFIRTRGEAEALREQILAAQNMKTLADTISGMPPPPGPQPRRDWGLPERFGPLYGVIGLIGALVATAPVTALAHHGDSFSNTISAVCIVVGIIICIAAIIGAIAAACSWDDAGQFERERRRTADRNRKR